MNGESIYPDIVKYYMRIMSDILIEQDLFDFILSDGEDSVKIIIDHLKSNQNIIYEGVISSILCSNDKCVIEIINRNKELKHKISDELKIKNIIRKIDLEE